MNSLVKEQKLTRKVGDRINDSPIGKQVRQLVNGDHWHLRLRIFSITSYVKSFLWCSTRVSSPCLAAFSLFLSLRPTATSHFPCPSQRKQSLFLTDAFALPSSLTQRSTFLLLESLHFHDPCKGKFRLLPPCVSSPKAQRTTASC